MNALTVRLQTSCRGLSKVSEQTTQEIKVCLKCYEQSAEMSYPKAWVTRFTHYICSACEQKEATLADYDLWDRRCGQ